MKKVKSSNMKHPEHICRFNDGDCVCTCYAEGYEKGQHDERLEIEKLKLQWSDIGYRNGVEAMKECIPDIILDNGHKRTEPEPTEDEKAFNDGYNLCRQEILSALSELLIDKS